MQEHKFFLHPGQIYMNREPAIVSTVLGSCISIFLFDKALSYGGVNHFIYPNTTEKSQATCKYGNVAIKKLINMMIESGSLISNLEAKMIGGSNLFDEEYSIQVGKQNIALAKKILNEFKIHITHKDVGGKLGRKVFFKTSENKITIIKIKKISPQNK